MSTSLSDVYAEMMKTLTERPRSSWISGDRVGFRVTKVSDRRLVVQLMHQKQKAGYWSDLDLEFSGDVFNITRKSDAPIAPQSGKTFPARTR